MIPGFEIKTLERLQIILDLINSSPGGPVSWGSITGTLSSQTDLQTALDDKVPYTGATTNVDLGEYQLKAGQVEFDQTPTGTFDVAKMRWNDTDGVPEVRLKGGNVTGQVFLENLKRIVNKTGADLLEANYQVVRIRTVAEGGAVGQRLAVKLAMADSDANSATTLGVVTETILNNQEGFINIGGEVKEIDTTGTLQGETWNDGDVLYLSGTVAGQLTNIKPIAPTHTIIVGFVSYKHAVHGKIDVKVDNGYELDELHNVAITTPANNDLLTYESSTSLWKNKQLTLGIVTTALGYTPQEPLSLTTSGTSGPATLSGNTLNIPEYSGGSSQTALQKATLGYEYYNDFLSTPTLSGTADGQGYIFFFSGTSASVVSSTQPAVRALNQHGFIRPTTGTVATGYAGLYGGSSGNQFLLGGGVMTFQTSVLFNTVSDGTNRYRVTIGYGDQATSAAEVNGIFFTYDEGGTANGTIASPNWQCITTAGSVRTLTTSTIPVSTTAWHTLKIEINAGGTSVNFYIDGTLVNTHTSNIPSGSSQAVTPRVNITKTIGTVSRFFHMDYIYYAQTYTTPKSL